MEIKLRRKNEISQVGRNGNGPKVSDRELSDLRPSLCYGPKGIRTPDLVVKSHAL